MHPVLFKILGVRIYSYGVLFALGVSVVLMCIYFHAKKKGLPAKELLDVCFYIILWGIIGARLLYVVENISFFKREPLEIFMITHGGLSFFGGLIGGTIAGIISSKRRKLDLLELVDLFFLYLPLGHAIGRIGCFLNGCCYGKPTALPWGVRFPPYSYAAEKFGILHKVHPVQLYNSGMNLIIFSVLYVLYKRRKFKVEILSTYFILYGTGRFLMEYLRGDHVPVLWGMTEYQVLSLIGIGVGGWIWLVCRRKDARVF